MRHSELNNKLSISKKRWAISLARLPKSRRSQHAFIIIEGLKQEVPVIWFIDLVWDRKKKLGEKQFIRGLQGQSKIRIKSYRDEEELLYQCNERMMDIRPGDEICSKTWNISKEKAIALIKEAKIDQKNPPIFHLAGKNNITTWASSSADGHNCFSWAREKLRNLRDKRISIPEDTIDKWLASVTSRHLPSKHSSAFTFVKQHPYKTGLTALGIASFGTALYFKFNYSPNLGEQESKVIGNSILATTQAAPGCFGLLQDIL